jgi:LysM repeat protein
VRTRVRYRVRRGDSLGRIAKKHHLKLRQLKALNPGVKRRLKAGQLLWVVVEGPSPDGSVDGLYQLSSAPGFRVRYAKRAWGTYLTVTRLIEVLSKHHRKYPRKPPLRVDDISKKGGGRLPPHKSHRSGRDVDIRFPLKIKNDKYVKAQPSTLDVKRTWDLIQSFIETNDVVYVFVDYKLQKVLYAYAREKRRLKKKLLKEWFQYPRPKRAMKGIIRHEPGHDTHLHVRFRKLKPGETPTS